MSALPCHSCGRPDADCLAEARTTGKCCCTNCREWPMHEAIRRRGRDQQQGPEDYPTAPEAPAATCACGCPDAYCLTLGEVLIHSADGCRVHLIGGRG